MTGLGLQDNGPDGAEDERVNSHAHIIIYYIYHVHILL